MPSAAGLPHAGNSALSLAQLAIAVLVMLDIILALSLNVILRLEAREDGETPDLLAGVKRTSKWMWKQFQAVSVRHLPALKELLVEYERILKDLEINLNANKSIRRDRAQIFVQRLDLVVLATKAKIEELNGFLPYPDDPGPNIQNTTTPPGILTNPHGSKGFLPYADDPGPDPSSAAANFFQHSQNVKILGGTFTINQGVSDSKWQSVQQQVSWIQLQIVVLFA
ncbi:hypothetical protein CPB83DRAFT_848827 [Crepidotus variabilis]|uniref:Uncharacterized protein n=1 Tax=Crepidotus variabilis TaxID=179855 RepID=A0A9P6JSV8_9AGAR|nr:hypothetical protein CPB83DRAFT_848827 [Crepidotus variabilis]